ncbi:MAG: cyclic nucleotide-binding domain-containing protein [Elusimicrobia bacterium]|nr:cyclic nucleotide-binding domain-containing protein [Elusimicrobiota bacterium]
MRDTIPTVRPGGVIRLFESLFGIRPEEFRLVQSFFLYFFLIGMDYTAGSTAGETLFLARLGPEAAERLLPWVYVGVAVATVGITVLYDRLEGKVRRIRMLMGSQVCLALSLLAFRAAVATGHTAAYFGLAVWVEAVDLFSITLFFSYAGDFFTTRDARRLYGYITGGLAVGILASGILVEPIVAVVKTEGLLYLCALLQVGCAGVCLWISRNARPLESSDSEDEGEAAPLKAVFANPFLRIAFLIGILCAVCMVLADYEMKIVASRSMSEEVMAVWFGRFYGVMGVASFVVQFVLVGWLLNRLGIMKCLMILPVLLAASSVAAFGLPTLMMVALSNFLLLTLAETLEQPAEELLFLPLPKRLRIRAQTLVDGALTPIGQGIGGALLLLLAMVSLKVEQVAGIIVVLAGAWFFVIRVIRPRYQQVLETSLRRQTLGSVDLESLMGRGDSRTVVSGLLSSGDREVRLCALDLLAGRPLAGQEDAVAALAGSEDEGVSIRALRLLGDHGSDRSLAAVRRCLETGSVPIRRAALLALGPLAGEASFDDAARRVDAPEEPLRIAALFCLARHGGFDGALLAYPRIDALLKSPDPGRRAEAARLLGRGGVRGTTKVLKRLFWDPAVEVRREALHAARALRNPALAPHVIRLIDDFQLRPAAIQALDAMPPEAVGPIAEAMAVLAEGHRARVVLTQSLGAIGGPQACRLLWDLIRPDGTLDLELTAARSLRRLRGQGSADLVLEGFEEHVEALAGRISLVQSAGDELGPGAEASAFYEDHARLGVELVLSILALRFDPQKLARIETGLLGSNEAQRANAAELLESLLPDGLARRVVPLVARTRAAGTAAGELSAETSGRLLSTDAWTRAITVFHLTRGGPVPAGLGGRAMNDEDVKLQKVVMTVSFLKQVPLFKSVPADFLASLANIISEKHVYKGEELFSQGDAGDSIYVVAEGKVRVIVGGKETALLGPRSHIGEMSLLDGEPRSATAVVAEDGRLLRIGAEEFRHLLMSHPGFTMALLRSLAGRLRETMGRSA